MNTDVDNVELELLVRPIVSLLTGLTQEEVAQRLSPTISGVSAISDPMKKLKQLVETAPMRFNDRQDSLKRLDELDALPATTSNQIARRVLVVLRSAPVHIPTESGPVALEYQPNLEAAIGCLNMLDENVVQPWTLIGGFMTQVHCAEMEVAVPRATDDLDIAVSVFMWTC